MPGVVLLAILLISPGFKHSTERIIHYNQSFEEPAPFKFLFNENQFSAIQNEPIRIDLELKGSEIPSDAYILLDNLKYKMKSGKDGKFHFELPGQQRSAILQFQAAHFKSNANTLKILRKPSLLAYDARLEFPAYLNRKEELLKGTGNISLPVGTKIHWTFKTKEVNQLKVMPQSLSLEVKENIAQFSKAFNQSEKLSFHTSNQDLANGDSLNYRVQVVPDLYPSIRMESKTDSSSAKVLYLIGDIKDDHGFTKLSFHYQIGEQAEQTVPIPFSKNVDEQSFFHLWNLKELGIKAGDQLSYYFKVWDNDGINGAKSVKTRIYEYQAPSVAEIQNKPSSKMKK